MKERNELIKGKDGARLLPALSRCVRSIETHVELRGHQHRNHLTPPLSYRHAMDTTAARYYHK